MNTELQFFQFKESSVRIILDADDNIWFVARDIAEALGYTNSSKAIADHCKKSKLLKSLNNNESLLFFENKGLRLDTQLIPESDIYRLAMRSKLESAEVFQDWIVEQVLPSIRKHGYYLPSTVVNNDSLNEVTGHLPFQRLNTAKFAELRKISKELAQAYLLECGITPEYVKSKIGLAGDYAAANIYGGAAAHGYLPSLVAAFVKNWQDGSLGAPFIHCQSGQALRLFMRYADNNGISVRHGENHIIEALSQTPELYKKRVRLSKGQYANPKSIIMIHGLKTPEGQEQGGFVADCVSRMEAVLINLKD